jgi:hypothetical protein
MGDFPVVRGVIAAVIAIAIENVRHKILHSVNRNALGYLKHCAQQN